ncbi:transglycosylase family protein [Streptomyces alkaliterrae]|uniref:Peptidoglycan DD-metalloendopeptidase family protein n=1 Tax=Streptomyces alkaliterrae TaxID=2213162 RepID=A0A5P0YPQ5_9ACTN|nr:transglycosylase family protein [Streptomyces alkaliterrae]MBB1258359.1 transglycosylase family protein [Streptomyces alkaliterrae]MQS02344.1 peptidoglycan DD-metalloendopeptidase family protein [Streptomyces alkaliterrae]
MARGRHRRYKPSPVTRASLTVTAGGAGIALPLIGVSHAQAAPVEVWDKVAACESSGRWQVNTGNGYFGGLQFKQSTWQEFGGTAYARRADLATKEQQIAIAEKVLKGQGPGAWPSCSVRAGLTRDMAQTNGSAVRAARDASRAQGGTRADQQPKAKNAERTERTARTQKTAAPPTAGKRPSGQEHRDGAAGHRVRRGDSLFSIARAHGVSGGWQALYERNRTVVGGDPDLIIPGQRLQVRGSGPKAPAAGGPARGGKAPEAAKKAEAEAARKKAEAAAKAEAERQAQAQKASRAQSTAAGFTAPVSAAPGARYRTTGGTWAAGYHTGVDFPVPTGTSVRAVTGGTVVSAGWAGSYGYQVVLRHHDGRYSQYAHLSAISVRSGQQVNTGQSLGRSGSTGNSTGPHLHFEVRTGPGYGSDIDPLAYLRGKGVRI